MKLSFLIFLILLQILFVNCQTSLTDSIFIRTNQVGFLPEDIKTAIVLSKINLDGKQFFVVENKSSEIKFEGSIKDKPSVYGNFNFCYEIDFSNLQTKGNYKIKLLDLESYAFQIDNSIFNDVRDSLSLFFKAQRCGPTNPILHQPCHLSDAAKIIGYKDSTARDLTGGWHDAGDYVKFLKTTALTTYLLLFSYEFDPQKFGYDLDTNNVSDILEEAKVGLDWLLRCNVDNHTLVSQVQNETDHNIGWRLPENDSLQFERSAFVSIGKNTIGIYAATLALASRIWKQKFYENEFADNCLTTAERFYSLRNNVQDIDSAFSNHYLEKEFSGKLALAAIELFNSSANQKYLDEAINYGRKAGSDYWWSVGDINSLAHYKIAFHNSSFGKYIYQNLKYFKQNSDSSLLREGLAYSWGTTNTFLGVNLQSILYKKLTGSTEFDSLGIFQRDYILGRNPWGISFIYNIGKVFPQNLHSQIAFFNSGYLPGALSEGPAPLKLLEKYKIKRSNFTYNQFNSDSVKYYDDRFDYITNEPTIIGNATALFVFGCFSN
ncbi:MAG: glycoside hydrolase family 9 protein [Ignavibacteriales bacterium]|nr:glycoside hydrolase family 9 protein [Ignavibacteriales bacterium]